jgi:hypothetical protein
VGVRVAPRDMFRAGAVQIWEQVLRSGSASSTRFEIGGHSLLAARLVDEIGGDRQAPLGTLHRRYDPASRVLRWRASCRPS